MGNGHWEMPMPWSELKPMEQRLLFIADHLRHVDGVSALCERYGISRKDWL